MANFLGSLGAAFQGQQNYQAFETQQEQAKLRIEAEKQNLAQIKDLVAEAKQNKKLGEEADEGYWKVLGKLGQPGLPPPPPSAQPPAPGQASVPMIQPNAQYGQIPIGPQGSPKLPQGGPPPMPPQGLIPPPPGGGAPMPQGGPPMPQQAPGGPPGGQQGPQQAQPPIPPYRTVQGASQQPQGPQQAQQGIPPPPPQQQAVPRPNSMTLADAAQFIQAQGITNPRVAVKILDKLSPYLDQQAQQQANQLKQQQLQQDKERALVEKAREADQNSRDKRYSTDQQAQWHQEAMAANRELRLIGLGIAQQNANTKSKEAGGGAGLSPDGKPGPGVEAAAWNYLLKNQSPPARGGLYGQTMAYVEQIAKENNMTVQELTSASADVKTKLQAKKNFEVRAQNMERAENQIIAEVPLIRDAIKNLDLSKYPKFAKAQIWGLRELGDERITRLDQAVETVFNEFEGIRTGNPGALNVSDVQNAHKAYEDAKTPQQMEAAIQGIERTIANAKKAKAKTDASIMKDINDSFKKEKPGAAVPVFSNQAELAAAIKSGKLKKGDTFNDPSGTAHTVN